jgi:hypothetical protein
VLYGQPHSRTRCDRPMRCGIGRGEQTGCVGSPFRRAGRARSAAAATLCSTWCPQASGIARRTAACASARSAICSTTGPARIGPCPMTSGPSSRPMNVLMLDMTRNATPLVSRVTCWEYPVVERVVARVPADNHQAGLGSGRDIHAVPPANDPELEKAPGRFVPTHRDASGIAEQVVRAILAGTLPPTSLSCARCYADLAHVRRFSST